MNEAVKINEWDSINSTVAVWYNISSTLKKPLEMSLGRLATRPQVTLPSKNNNYVL